MKTSLGVEPGRKGLVSGSQVCALFLHPRLTMGQWRGWGGEGVRCVLGSRQVGTALVAETLLTLTQTQAQPFSF